MGAGGKIVKSFPPNYIFLQMKDEYGEDHDEITWCIDQINETDVEYMKCTYKDWNITKKQGDKEIEFRAGLAKLDGKEADDLGLPGVSEDDIPRKSKNLKIILRGATCEELTDPGFQDNQAIHIFEWMKDNLPHGIYQSLLDKMVLADRATLD